MLILGEKTLYMPMMCDCEAKEVKRDKDEFIHQQTVRNLTIECFYPNDFSKKTFANDDVGNEELTLIAKKYVEEFEEHQKNGKGLLLFGECDVGKSYIASCIANALIEKEIPVRMTNFAYISSAIEGWGSRKEFIEHLLTYRVLIIDDLCTERDTTYMNEIVYYIINAWTSANKPLIVTTNLTGEEMKRPKGINYNRIYSRLFEKCIPYEVKGNHRRNKECVEYTKKFMKGIK